MDIRSLQTYPRREPAQRKRSWAAKLVRSWEPQFGVGQSEDEEPAAPEFDFSRGGSESDADVEDRSRATSWSRQDFFPEYGPEEATPEPPDPLRWVTEQAKKNVEEKLSSWEAPSFSWETPDIGPPRPDFDTSMQYDPEAALQAAQPRSPSPEPDWLTRDREALAGPPLSQTTPAALIRDVWQQSPTFAPIREAAAKVGEAIEQPARRVEEEKAARAEGENALLPFQQPKSFDPITRYGPGNFLNNIGEALRDGWGVLSAASELSAAATQTAVKSGFGILGEENLLERPVVSTEIAGQKIAPSVEDVISTFMDPAIMAQAAPVELIGRAAIPFIATVVPALAYGKLIRPAVRSIFGAEQGLQPITKPFGAAVAGELGSTVLGSTRALPATLAAGTALGTVAGGLATPEDRMQGAEIGAATGFAGMLGLYKASGILRALADPTKPAVVSSVQKSGKALTQGAQQMIDMLEQGHAAEQGFVSSRMAPQQYPGGQAKLLFDQSVRKLFTDHWAPLETEQNFVNAMHTRMFGAPLADEAQPYTLVRLIAGIRDKIAAQEKHLIKPAFEAAGLDIKNKVLMDDFSSYASARMTMLRAHDGIPTGPVKDVGSAMQGLYEVTSNIANRHKDPNIAARFNDVMDTLTTYANDQIQQMAATGRITQKEANKIIASRGVWMAVSPAESQSKLIDKLIQIRSEAVVPTMDLPGFEHPENAVPVTDLPGTLAAFASRTATIEKQKVWNGLFNLKEAANRVGLGTWGTDFLTRKELNARVGVKFGQDVPRGWKALEGYRNGEKTEMFMPDWEADLLMGTDNKLMQIHIPVVGYANQMFRLGATSVSPSFLFHNWPKDLQDRFQNIGLQVGLGRAIREQVSMMSVLLTSEEFSNVQRGGPAAIAAGAGWFSPELGDWLGVSHEDPKQVGSQERLGRAMTAGAAQYTVGPVLKNLMAQTSIWKEVGALLDRGLDIQGSRAAMKEAMEQGIRSGTQAASGRTEAQKRLGGLIGSKSPLDRATGLITSPAELLRSVNEVMELSNRLPTYKMARSQGMTPQQATLLTREVTIDFDKGGDIMKVLSAWHPLLNARAQGVLRSVRAFDENPGAYTARAAGLSMGATALTYWWNRHASSHSDLYDKIPQDDRDNYWPIIYGSYRGGLLDEEKPLYFKIAKNDVSGLFGAAFEAALEGIYHTKDQRGQDLPFERRTERSPWDMFKGRMAQFAPFRQSQAFDDAGRNAVAGFLGSGPLERGALEWWSGKNLDSGDPYLPDDQKRLPWDYQMGQTYHPSSWALSSWLNHLGGKGLQIPPADIVRSVQTLGASAGTFLLNGADAVVESLGITPQRPLDYTKMTKPEGMSWSDWATYLDKLDYLDKRPAYARLLSGIIGSAGGQQTIRAKLQDLPASERNRWERTVEFFGEQQRYKSDVYTPEEKKIFAQRQDTTHRAIMEKAFGLWEGNRLASADLRRQFSDAILDPQERKQFIANLPGLPLDQVSIAQSADLPSGVTPDMIRQRYYNPVDPTQMAAMPQQRQERMRQIELAKMAKEYGVSSQTLQAVIKLSEPGRRLPIVGVPQTYLDDALSRWLSPPLDKVNYQEPDPDNPGQQRVNAPALREARRREVDDMSREFGISPQDLQARIGIALSPVEQPALEQSLRRALDASAEIHDPAKYPAFVATDGTPMSRTPSEEAGYRADLKQWEGQRRVPDYIRQLRIAEKNGSTLRMTALLNYKDATGAAPLVDYLRWFGKGASQTPAEFDAYVRGDKPRYSEGTPEDWLQWDRIISLYEHAPRGSLAKEQFAEMYQLIRPLHIAREDDTMGYDEINQRKYAPTDVDVSVESRRRSP